MRPGLRYPVIALLLALGLAAIGYLQFRFDHSDLKNAVGAVRAARPAGPADPTLEEKITKKFGVPPEQISWLAEIESKFKGTVKVRAVLPKGEKDLVFQVDLVRMAVAPLSEDAKGLIQDK